MIQVAILDQLASKQCHSPLRRGAVIKIELQVVTMLQNTHCICKQGIFCLPLSEKMVTACVCKETYRVK
jgi:hypothetical protein